MMIGWVGTGSILAVSAFGYTVPIEVLLILAALFVVIGLAVLFWLTIGLSVYRSVVDTRREDVHDACQSELVSRLYDSDPEWQSWVASAAAVEQTVMEQLLDEYLRELEGTQAATLAELGNALDIPARARKRLNASDEYARLSALTWLTLLERPDIASEVGFTPQTQRERTALVRLQYESDVLEPREGLEEVFAAGDVEFTVFGQDTLYRVAQRDPAQFFETAGTYQSWSREGLVQVLEVSRYLGGSGGMPDLSWLTVALEHELPQVRATATLALAEFGWRPDIREQAFVTRILDDSSPRVRAAAYQTLAAWGDDDAFSQLLAALEEESDERARLRGARAMVQRQRGRERAPTTGPVWEWVHEHARFDEAATARSGADETAGVRAGGGE